MIGSFRNNGIRVFDGRTFNILFRINGYYGTLIRVYRNGSIGRRGSGILRRVTRFTKRVTFTAIYRAVSGRLERDLAFFFAIGAHGFIHRPVPAPAVAIPAAASFLFRARNRIDGLGLKSMLMFVLLNMVVVKVRSLELDRYRFLFRNRRRYILLNGQPVFLQENIQFILQ